MQSKSKGIIKANGERLEAKGKRKEQGGQFNCPETTKKEKAGYYPAKLTKQKGGSGEPMSEYDSDAMDKATGGKNATERDNQHIMRGQNRKAKGFIKANGERLLAKGIIKAKGKKNRSSGRFFHFSLAYVKKKLYLCTRKG